MTMKNKFATLIAFGLIASAVAAHADGATIPDPNLAQTSSESEPALVATNASSPELASIPDPNLAPTTGEAEPSLVATNANGPELASIPDPNMAPAATDEAEGLAGMLSSRGSSASETAETVQQ
jgi:hypothetical protein